MILQIIGAIIQIVCVSYMTFQASKRVLQYVNLRKVSVNTIHLLAENVSTHPTLDQESRDAIYQALVDYDHECFRKYSIKEILKGKSI